MNVLLSVLLNIFHRLTLCGMSRDQDPWIMELALATLNLSFAAPDYSPESAIVSNYLNCRVELL